MQTAGKRFFQNRISKFTPKLLFSLLSNCIFWFFFFKNYRHSAVIFFLKNGPKRNNPLDCSLEIGKAISFLMQLG